MSHDSDSLDDDVDTEPMLNEQAYDLVQQVLYSLDELRVEPADYDGPGIVLDFGVYAAGSLNAGLALTEICMSGLCDLSIAQGKIFGVGWPHLQVRTDNPAEACLLSQYAGWRISNENYFAMGSGPMRAAVNKEPLFDQLGYRESADAVVGVLEADHLPSAEIIEEIAEACDVHPNSVALAVAPTSSISGNMQVIGRSVETAMHKLHEIGFDVTLVESAFGTAPVSPVARDSLTGIGRTNDAILYAGHVTLWVSCEDSEIEKFGPKVPSSSSTSFGKPFLELFEEAGKDFYNMDPDLFSPAEIIFHNLRTGNVFCFGKSDHEVLKKSFGIRN